MAECKECIHYKVCPVWDYHTDDFAERNADTCKNYLPAADVVEVVRCKDCKYWLGFCGECDLLADFPDNVEMEGTDFCSRGERKE